MEKKRLKILFITFEYDKVISGGIGRVVNGLVPLITKHIDLHIMLVRNYRIYKFTRFYRFFGDKPLPKYFRLNPQTLINLIGKEKYDIVHIFHCSMISSTIIQLIKEYFPKLKIVYSCHSIAKYEFKIRNINPDFLKYEDYIVNHSDHFHLLNQTSLQYFQASYPAILSQKSFSIIPNGVAADSFQEKDTGFTEKMNHLLNKNSKITVLCMSRWSWGKGLEFLLDAIPKVLECYQNIQFVIAGRKFISWEYKHQNFLRKINSQIRALNDYVIALNWLNDRQRNSLFTYTDIWVMPSQLEYFPYSILEPMMAKIPIISSRIASVSEILKDNCECLFYEPTNSEQLAAKLLTLIHNPDLRMILSNNAYRKAQQYSWGNIVNRYIKMYYEVVYESKGVAPYR